MFRFKQFSVEHDRSSMKVGIDGVLVGCWADASWARSILDVGTGCGLIALIMAQRCKQAEITGIDIDIPSIEEAQENVAASEWSDRVRIIKAAFPEETCNGKYPSRSYDFVVSNPPYFDSGIEKTTTAREKARHQGDLSPVSLLDFSRRLLNKYGGVAMIVPAESANEIELKAEGFGYRLRRECLVRGHEKAPWKRVLLQWDYGESVLAACNRDELTLEISPGMPTDKYRALCKDFYLKF